MDKVQELDRTKRIMSGENSPEETLTILLGEAYRNYRVKWEESSKKNTPAPSFPIHLDLELQDFCNQSCIMCPRNQDFHPNLPYLLETKKTSNVEQLQEVIRSGIESGLQSVNFGAFSEPLIHKGLWKLIKDSHASGLVDSRVITNGLLLDRYVDEIFDSGLRNLFVSIDAATEETYSKIRGRGFNKIIQNLEDILQERRRRQSKLPVIRVSFVEMEINRSEVSLFKEMWKNKVDHIDIQHWSDYTQIPNSRSLPKKFSCRSPWQRMSILATGEILPCCDFNGRSLVIGNIHEDSLLQAWNSSEMKLVRDELQDDTSSVCFNCQRGYGIQVE